MIMLQFFSWLLITFNTIFFSCTAQPRKKEVESGAQNGGKVDSKEISSKDVANISTHGDGMNKTVFLNYRYPEKFYHQIKSKDTYLSFSA